ncbi:MAG: hypothetical protein ABID83_01835 [Candidatus Omnitrophota bacterium]
MTFYLIGIDHKTVPLMMREETYRQRQDIHDFWQTAAGEAAVLFTCNRVEIYGVAENRHSAREAITLFQGHFPELFGEAYAENENNGTLRHALRLASGLESQLIGEREILEQLSSWARRLSGNLQLQYFWDRVIRAAKEIRTMSGLEWDNSDVAEIILKDLSKKQKIIVVGTGKIAGLFAEKRTEGIEMIFVARKKHKQAKQLARKAGGTAVLMDDLSDRAADADVLVSATTSPHYVISLEQMFEIRRRRQKDLYVFDLAVPRDIEPGAESIPGIFVKNIDDLAINFDKRNARLLPQIKRAELLIEDKMRTLREELVQDAFKGWHKAQFVGAKTG